MHTIGSSPKKELDMCKHVFILKLISATAQIQWRGHGIYLELHSPFPEIDMYVGCRGWYNVISLCHQQRFLSNSVL